MFIRFLFCVALLLFPLHAGAQSWIDEGRVSAGGATLAYRMYGQGEPLLLITGYGVTMDLWPEEFLEALASERRVIVFDNRGMGDSTADYTPLSIKLMAEDTAQLLRGLDVEQAAVLGWSMGGCIAQELTLDHPELVSKLVLYATDVENPAIMQSLKRITGSRTDRPAQHLFPDAWMDAHEDYQDLLPSMRVVPNAEMMTFQREAIAEWPGTKGRMGEIRLPVLFLTGDQDEVVPAERSRLASQLVSGPAWLVNFTNAGHGLVFQAPADVADIVLAFLRVRQQVQ
ncbi:MAG: alpha/beta hydrolase [Desulfovibrio sp.]|nr:alpha/beta hydrolase [Desulfovibrio sp.]